MDATQRLLFSGFPRSVGVTTPQGRGELRQFMVHNEDEFDLVLEKNDGRRSLYSSISWFRPILNGKYLGNEVILDKVFYDLDTTAKSDEDGYRWDHPEIEPDEDDRSVLARMREDSSLAESLLGPVVEDAHRLATASLEDGIPIVGVFSGFGIHVYQLFAPESNPKKALSSTAIKYVEEEKLATADEAVVGDYQRITRIPNVKRVDGEEETDTYCVPLSGRELVSLSVEEILGLSTQPRPEVYQTPAERPEMEHHQEYANQTPGEIRQEKMRGVAVEFEKTHDEEFREMLKQLLPMPCVHERAVQPNPDHPVRYNVAAGLFNLGFTLKEAHDLIRRLDWIDYDPEVTGTQLKSIWRGSTGEKGCARMMAHGLCRRADNPESCPAYRWRGGDQHWTK